jgi:hypothetical protein
MPRALPSIRAALILMFAAVTAQAQSLVGTWSATVNWNLPSGIMITSSFTSDGRLQSTTQNHMGPSFSFFGTYQFDAGQGSLLYQWQDFAPKQICTGTLCTPAPAPAPMGVRPPFLSGPRCPHCPLGDISSRGQPPTARRNPPVIERRYCADSGHDLRRCGERGLACGIGFMRTSAGW